MGANFARDLASGEFGLSLDRAIEIHLTANHYPPVPTSLVPVCIQAIEAVNQGYYTAWIDLPEGITWKGHSEATAIAIVEEFHLDEFILDGDPDDDDGI